ncbi:MAG: MarR family transcriptional regulator [Actinobacteria bacterium]|nr:MarR family transcriptional regulator [Actinomycetota bacterium]
MEKIKDIKVVMDILKTLFEFKNSLIGDLDKQVHNQNINRSEFITLINISDNKKKSMGELCCNVDLKSGSLTTLIDNLVEKGYVKREFDKDDRRKILVQLTTKGKNFTKIIKKSFEENTLSKIEKLTAKENKDLFEAVSIIKETAIKLKGED